MNLNFVAKQIICITLLAASLSLMADTETIGSYTWRYQINGDTAEIYKSYYSAAISPSPTGTVCRAR